MDAVRYSWKFWRSLESQDRFVEAPTLMHDFLDWLQDSWASDEEAERLTVSGPLGLKSVKHEQRQILDFVKAEFSAVNHYNWF